MGGLHSIPSSTAGSGKARRAVICSPAPTISPRWPPRCWNRGPASARQVTFLTAPADGGSLLLVTEPGSKKLYRAGELFRNRKRVVAVNFSAAACRALEEELGTAVTAQNELPSGETFDDIVCVDLQDRTLGEQAIALAGDHAVVTFFGNCGSADWAVDVGALHYKNRFYQGVPEGTLDAAYPLPRRQTLRKGGAVWFPGGAGAMGQMHVELAVLSPDRPSKILVTDLDPARLDHLRAKLGKMAEEQGVTLEFLNPDAMTTAAFEQKLNRFAPAGFDDIVILISSANAVDQAIPHLADNGLINVFAGIPAGETAEIPVNRGSARQRRDSKRLPPEGIRGRSSFFRTASICRSRRSNRRGCPGNSPQHWMRRGGIPLPPNAI